MTTAPTSQADKAYETLRDLLITLEIKPGAPIGEDEMPRADARYHARQVRSNLFAPQVLLFQPSQRPAYARQQRPSPPAHIDPKGIRPRPDQACHRAN